MLLSTSTVTAVRIVNEASGIACYSSQDLMTAHSALGFFNHSQVQLLIARDKCFVMRKHWSVKVDEERTIGGVNVKMVKVRLDNQGADLRIAWTLLANLASP